MGNLRVLSSPDSRMLHICRYCAWSWITCCISRLSLRAIFMSILSSG